MNDLKKTRNNLINMLEDLDERLGDINTEPEQLSESGPKTLKNKENQSPISFEHVNMNEIERIKQAISSIDSGSYGICLKCGQSIKKEQLNRQSFSSQCQNCTEKRDAN